MVPLFSAAALVVGLKYVPLTDGVSGDATLAVIADVPCANDLARVPSDDGRSPAVEDDDDSDLPFIGPTIERSIDHPVILSGVRRTRSGGSGPPRGPSDRSPQMAALAEIA